MLLLRSYGQSGMFVLEPSMGLLRTLANPGTGEVLEKLQARLPEDRTPRPSLVPAPRRAPAGSVRTLVLQVVRDTAGPVSVQAIHLEVNRRLRMTVSYTSIKVSLAVLASGPDRPVLRIRRGIYVLRG